MRDNIFQRCDFNQYEAWRCSAPLCEACIKNIRINVLWRLQFPSAGCASKLLRYKKQTSEIEPTSHRSLDSIRKQRGKLKGGKLLRLNYLSPAATAAANNKRRARGNNGESAADPARQLPSTPAAALNY
jgi:hypothetical protein